MTYYLDPLGCVKNQVDAETMMAFLDRSGWTAAAEPERADLIIINSCGFIESAKQESINTVIGYRKDYPDKKILLAGCLAQRYAAALSGSLTEADAFFGNTDLSRIGEAAARVMGARDEGVASAQQQDAAGTAELVPLTDTGSALLGSRPLLSLPGSAYVKIAEGCNNHCTFCAIPGIRGPLRSRPIPDVVEECRRLLGRGIKELCLIGQDLGSYGLDRDGNVRGQGPRLPELLEALSVLDGDFWVRFLYIHPDNFPLPILDIIRRDSRFLPYFDIPFQHGSATILKAMNRRGAADSYLALVSNIRAALPDAVIRSTFLTGFPGETDDDFHALLDFQKALDLDWAGAFTYSREEDTPAYRMKPRVPKKLAAERKALIEEQQIPITQKRMDRFVGRTMDVLVEERISDSPDNSSPLDLSAEEDIYLGRLTCQAPEVDGAAVISSDDTLVPGAMVRGRVVARSGVDLSVQIVRSRG
ncbi:ribosomal protein S12 methylthiotransferase RimO [Spirochaetia bacterium]|nr:ribosomal protein S12 methylthiotransferase RimO [Spirochaetia bacterium]